MSDSRNQSTLRMIETKPPEHDAIVEASVLACMVASSSAIDYVLACQVEPKHFYRVHHALIFKTVCVMHAERRAVDLITLGAELASSGKLADAGGDAAIIGLFDAMPSTANVDSYVIALKQEFATRTRETTALEALRALKAGQIERSDELFKKAATPVEPPEKKPKPKKQQPPMASPRAAAGTIAALDEGELAALVRAIRALRLVSEDPESATHDEWLAALVYLVPFENGKAMAHAYADITTNADIEQRWDESVIAYSRADRAGSASISQKIVEHVRANGRDDIVPISHGYGISEGSFVKRSMEYKNGEWLENPPVQMTNFTCWVVSQDFQDDGTGIVQRRIRMGGQFAWGEPLQEFDMPAEEWTNMGVWLHKNWGHRTIIFNKREHAAPVLEAIALFSLDAPTKIVYAHTGWVELGGKHAYITSRGIVGLTPEAVADFEQNSTISLDKTFKTYHVAPACERADAIEAYNCLERFMQCADYGITAPIVASLFLAPLASKLPLSFMLAVCGPSDSKKSSLVAAAMTAYGRDFTADTFGMSFRDTLNFLVDKGFYGKDLPLVIDNYVPAIHPEQVRTLMGLAHSIGDNHARGRMLDGHRSLQSKPMRGFVIITGEESAAQHSSTARMYLVPMMKGAVKSEQLTKVQIAGAAGKLEPAMTHYINWLARKLDDETFIPAIRERWFSETRRHQKDTPDHGRLVAQRVWLDIALELAEQSHPLGRWCATSMALEVTQGLNRAAAERGQTVRGTSIVSTLFRSIKVLIDSGVLVGMDSQKAGHPPQINADVFGWNVDSVGIGLNKRFEHAEPAMWIQRKDGDKIGDPWFVLVNLDVIMNMIHKHVYNPMQDSPTAIGAALEGEGMLSMQPSERKLGNRAVPVMLPKIGRQRVLRILGSSMMSNLGIE